jgi:hypothetical protein
VKSLDVQTASWTDFVDAMSGLLAASRNQSTTIGEKR